MAAGRIPLALVGDTVKDIPEQVVAVRGFSMATGNTNTVRVNTFPLQLPADGVTT